MSEEKWQFLPFVIVIVYEAGFHNIPAKETNIVTNHLYWILSLFQELFIGMTESAAWS